MYWSIIILFISLSLYSFYNFIINLNNFQNIFYNNNNNNNNNEIENLKELRRQRILNDINEPLKILLIVEPTPFGYTSGYSNRFKEMLKHLKDNGDIVHIVTPDDSISPPDTYMNYPITTLTGYRLIFYDHVMLSIDTQGHIDRLMKEFQPDIVHVSTPGTILFPAIYYARKNKLPLLMSYHTHLPLYAKIYLPIPGSVAFAEFLLSTFLNMADLTLVTSPQLKQQVHDVGVNRVGIWQKGINTEKFSPKYRNQELRNKLTGGNESLNLLLYVGRLGAEKNLKILKQVIHSVPNTRLVFVGTGPYESELKNYFINDDVIFTGKKEGEELSELFASCDIFVMPSETETLGFVVLEAMASGIPVVAIGANGILDIIEHGKTGLLAYPSHNTIDQFIGHVKQLSQDLALRENISHQSRIWAEKWNWKTATHKLRTSQYRAAILLHQKRFNQSIDNIENSTLNEYFPLINKFFFNQSSSNMIKVEREILHQYSV